MSAAMQERGAGGEVEEGTLSWANLSSKRLGRRSSERKLWAVEGGEGGGGGGGALTATPVLSALSPSLPLRAPRSPAGDLHAFAARHQPPLARLPPLSLPPLFRGGRSNAANPPPPPPPPLRSGNYPGAAAAAGAIRQLTSSPSSQLAMAAVCTSEGGGGGRGARARRGREPIARIGGLLSDADSWQTDMVLYPTRERLATHSAKAEHGVECIDISATN